ncbi:MAG TPA: hypothetical protein VLE72_04660, partial [Candidatus Saccharimonadales bacterium]|nr:hypothetical protein [Candidatus Saccharimonadales bacterium]
MAAVARENAAPIMSAIGRQLGRYLGWVKQTYRNRLSPGLKRSSLAIAAWLRRVLSHRRGRWLFLAGVVMVIFLGIFMLSRSGNDRSLGALAKQYQDALSKEAHAADQLSTGDKLGAKANYQASLDELNVVLASPKAAKLDAYLAKHRASEDDPASATKLRDLVSAQLDQIDGLTKVNPGQLADFSALGNAKPSLMVAVGSQLIFIDPSAASSIYRYDTAKAKLDIVADHPAKLGHVVAATPSSSGDGVYLLTDQPAVWFYNSNDSSLSQQTSAADWPKGKAIASYAGNLYIMADDAIYKLTRTAGGFSAKAAYPINDPSVLTNATTLAVDGNIYVGNAKGFTRILSGVVQKSDLIFPSNLMNPRAIISTNAAKSITVNDAKSNRIGLFSFDGAAIQSNGQISINGINTIYQTTGASSDKTMYVLADQKLVKISY